MSETKREQKTNEQQAAALKPEIHVYQYIIPAGALVPFFPIRPVAYPTAAGPRLLRNWMARRRLF